MPHLYRFEDVQIDLRSFRLFKAGEVVQVEPKALNLLVFLVENRGRLVEKHELLDAVWNDTFVTENVLTRAIAQLRKALADDPKEPRYIETVPTLGYRFIAKVEAEQVPEGAGTALIPSGEIASIPSRHARWRVPVVLGLTLSVVVAVAAFWIERRGGHISGGAPIRSLVVLPLENLSGDPSQEYLADGMTDELITALGQIGALRVISRTTATQYKNAHKSLPQIARELNVDAVVEGSVVRSGDQIRIAAQLIDAPADKQLWARSYDGDLRGVLGLQNKVAGAVAEEIRIQLTPNERTQLADAGQVNPRAYEALLKGYFFDRQSTPEQEQKALQYFRQAAELDPKFARAYVGIARSYDFLAHMNVVPTGEAMAASDEAVGKALELEPDLGEAYAERAWNLLIFHWDFPGAERDFRRALELDPSASPVHDGLAERSAVMGRFDEALPEIRRAQDLDPLNLVTNTDYCLLLRLARRYDDALAQCKATLDLDPNYRYTLETIREVYEAKKMYPEADKISVQSQLGDCTGSCTAALDEIHGAPGLVGSFDAWLKSQKTPPNPYFLSEAYAGLGRKDQAFAWLEKAYEQRSQLVGMVFLAVDPAFDSLHADPRFDAFLRRVGLPPRPHAGAARTDRPSN